jgi:fructoselysine 6-kinase
MPSFDFACVGDNCIDRFGAPLHQMLVGGNALNVAVQLARHGEKSAYFGAVGRDIDGDVTIKTLNQNNVSNVHIQRLDAPTAYTNLSFTPAGDRIIDFEEFGASGIYHPSCADLDILKKMRHVHIGWLKDGGTTKRFLRGHNVFVSQDLGVNAAPIDKDPQDLSLAFDSAGDDKSVARTRAIDLIKKGAKCAIVSCGANGSVGFDGHDWAETNSTPVNVVDTTGAGDSFAAGVIAALHKGKNLQQSLEQGRDWAALTCGHPGGFPQKMASQTP